MPSFSHHAKDQQESSTPPRRMFFFVFGGFFLVVGLLLVLTKHAALDRHLFSEQLALDAGITGARDRFFHLAASRVQSRQHHLQMQSQNSSTTIATLPITLTITKNPQKNNRKTRCLVSFPSKCIISKNLNRYWEETTDSCFVSPLRQQYGLQARNVTDRRYVVFQPDLGGWNNIRMALEVVILYALVTGRILVMPPHAVLYLLNGNKKWDANKSTMDDYLDFERMKAHDGLEVMEMDEFLTTVAGPGLLSKPLYNTKIPERLKPLWEYLESACYVRQWSPGKTFIAFNITSTSSIPSGVSSTSSSPQPVFGTFNGVSTSRLDHISLNRQRQLIPYDASAHSHRAVYFPGHDKNRLLTLWYGFFFFAEPKVERLIKRFMRDRVRYLDIIACAAGHILDHIKRDIQTLKATHQGPGLGPGTGLDQQGSEDLPPLVAYSNPESTSISDPGHRTEQVINHRSHRRVYRLLSAVNHNSYIAYHIRRGDFQQTHTRLPAEEIVHLTLPLIPGNASQWLVYIATDEKNISFFAPFFQTFGAVRFLSDYINDRTDMTPGQDTAQSTTKNFTLQDMNPNHLGMVEQLVCANAHTFIGTPLSTFTGFITRMRGFMNRTTVAGLPLPSSSPPSGVVVDLHEDKGQSKDKNKGKGKDNDKNKFKVDPPKNTGLPLMLLQQQQQPPQPSPGTGNQDPNNITPFSGPITPLHIGKLVPLNPSFTSPLSSEVGVGLYDRTFYFMKKFTYQLQNKPHLELPFWVREFSEPFEDTEDEEEGL